MQTCFLRNLVVAVVVCAPLLSGQNRSAEDRAAVIAILRDAGYRGWLVVEGEQDPAVAPSYRYADMGYRLLSALVAGKSDAEARAVARAA